MILHCMVCSIGGTHPGDHSKIASIDENTLRLPLDSSMFGSYWPERGLPAPWQDGLNWQEMKCPRFGRIPWTFMQDDTSKVMEQGGPETILTDQGVIRLLEDGWHGESDGVVVEELTEAPAVQDTSELTCPHCDFTAKSPRGLKAHITVKHKGERCSTTSTLKSSERMPQTEI